MRIAGSRVLITGAGHGLGFAIAEVFARAGASVVVSDIDGERVQQAVAMLPGACGYALDVTNAEQIAAVRERLNAEHGPIDILVNNAGIAFGGPFLEVPLAKHRTTFDVNLLGLIAVTHAFLPDLLARPAAHLVNIASASAVIALPHATTYAASKWAVLGFTESLQEELRLLNRTGMCASPQSAPATSSTGLFGGADPGQFAGWLTPEGVAAAVVRAVERDREFVMLPWVLRVMYGLSAGLPRSVYKWFCRVHGGVKSMMGWEGHVPPSK